MMVRISSELYKKLKTLALKAIDDAKLLNKKDDKIVFENFISLLDKLYPAGLDEPTFTKAMIELKRNLENGCNKYGKAYGPPPVKTKKELNAWNNLGKTYCYLFKKVEEIKPISPIKQYLPWIAGGAGGLLFILVLMSIIGRKPSVPTYIGYSPMDTDTKDGGEWVTPAILMILFSILHLASSLRKKDYVRAAYYKGTAEAALMLLSHKEREDVLLRLPNTLKFLTMSFMKYKDLDEYEDILKLAEVEADREVAILRKTGRLYKFML